MNDPRPPRPHRVLHLDDLEAIAGPGTLTWRPVRATLGLRAFGTNAYTSEEAGVDVVEPHTEDPKLAHEELYFVHRGRATFTVDGEQVDAPAGTYVFVPDPASHRHAVAAEPGTTVLSFGGPPTFQPSAWEWTFKAARARRAGDVEGARAGHRRGRARGRGLHVPTRRSGVHRAGGLRASPRLGTGDDWTIDVVVWP